jgi:hypothetical protein
MKPTTAELIELIDKECSIAEDMPIVAVSTKLLNDLHDHLSNPWISVEERLPTEQECNARNKRFLAIISQPNGQYRDCAIFDAGEWDIGYDIRMIPGTVVTHWCPLPPLPRKDGGE